MPKQTPQNKKLISELTAKLKVLQAELATANKAAGLDDNITVKVTENQARFERIRIKDAPDKGIGKFYLEIDITAKAEELFIPASIASGKRTAGFMYQIEGTDIGVLDTAKVSARGDGVTKVTVGTLLFIKIPAGQTATFRISIETNGRINEDYKVTINRISYKLALADARYQQYLKPLASKVVKFK